MRILLVNVPHPAIGSRIPKEQLPPLGLLAVGGPLIDDGHAVTLLDGEFGPMPLPTLVERIVAHCPDAVLFGHSGSSSAQPIVSRVAAAVAARLPAAHIVYGGVHPTYFWREILAAEPHVTAIVRGEGEETARRLMRALEQDEALAAIPGIAFHQDGAPFGTPPAPVITDLDAYRIGWELIDHARYSYWGGKRAVVIQFSRGCPHLCNYCGQRGFWTRWRHRDPVKLAAEIAHLHRVHGVEVFNFADENPSAGRKPWKAFLEALIAERLSVTLVGSTRADDIVRDADQIQALYVTPHRWTPYYRLAADRPVVQADQTKWDYKHQVLGMERMAPWRLFLWVKAIEAIAQLRPRALLRWAWHPDPKIRHAIRWYYRMGRRVWIHEMLGFFLRDRTRADGRTVAAHLGAAQDHEEEASAVARRASRSTGLPASAEPARH